MRGEVVVYHQDVAPAPHPFFRQGAAGEGREELEPGVVVASATTTQLMSRTPARRRVSMVATTAERFWLIST
jgi:hypothetical protein